MKARDQALIPPLWWWEQQIRVYTNQVPLSYLGNASALAQHLRGNLLVARDSRLEAVGHWVEQLRGVLNEPLMVGADGRRGIAVSSGDFHMLERVCKFLEEVAS